MPLSHPDRETFTVDEDGLHVHRRPRRGRPYTHTCPQASFETACHLLEERHAAGEHRHRIEDLTGLDQESGVEVLNTHAAVALAFLRERGIIDHPRRWSSIAPGYVGTVHLSGMIEYYALEHAGREGAA